MQVRARQKKVQQLLTDRFCPEQVPSCTTIYNILKAEGGVSEYFLTEWPLAREN